MKGYARPKYPALRAIHVMLFVKRLGDLYGLGLKDVLVDYFKALPRKFCNKEWSAADCRSRCPPVPSKAPDGKFITGAW